MNEFLYNTMYRTCNKVDKLEINADFANKNIVVVSDEHDIAYQLCGAYSMLNKADNPIAVHLVVDRVPCNELLMQDFSATFDSIHYWTSLDDYFSAKDSATDGDVWQNMDEIIIDFVNLRQPCYSVADENRGRVYDKKKQEIRAILDHNKSREGNVFQLVTCIPDISKPLPDVLHAVAEREYEVVFRDKPDDSPEKFAIGLEQMLRDDYSDMTDRMQVIRLDRVFGPGIYSDDCTCINSIYRDIRDGKPVVIRDEDRYDYFSVSFVCDALFTLMIAVATGRMGNIYHISSWEINRFQVINYIFSTFTDMNIRLETEHDDIDHIVTYRLLNSKKSELMHFRNISSKIRTDKKLAFDDTGKWFFDVNNYIPRSDLNVYYGRMDRIREVELEILKEVDRICRENDIPYFLAAGTMLGAVRHKGFIPWDDDIDIGMLPEDYERFIKVCPDSLSVDYGYQCAMMEKENHYIHDKIRLRNSFFSTKYSNRYNMLNGVYIDVFLYYKTADSPRAQQKHINSVRKARNLLGIRWADRKYQRGRFYRLCYDISHRIKGSFFDKYYRHICMKYQNKNTHYRIDGGFNLEKAGAVPDEWFHGTVDAEFCGYKFPILAHYNDFLTHWYSSHYMELLPVDGRKSVHDVVRIDIGQFLFDETKHDPRFRDVDLRGELYEKTK